MRVASLHYELVDDAVENRERLLDGLATALASADLAVGPETGTIYVEHPDDLDPDARRYARNAEPIDGETVTRARAIVERAGGVAVFGIPERADGERYNSCVVLEADREPRVLRRPHNPAWSETSGWVTAHGPLEIEHFETVAGTVQPVICADVLHRAEYVGAKNRGGAGIDVVASPANWRETETEYRDDDHEPLVDRWASFSAAMELPLVVSNSYRATEWEWPSAILDDGAVVARTDVPGEVLFATL